MLIIDKIKKRIQEEELIQAEDRIVVAISGGPDSVCLLHALYCLREELNIQLYGAHLNHNFRGIEALKDAQYVTKLCESLDMMCFVKSIDVGEYAKNNGRTLEEAGRILRYQFLDEVGEKVGATKIAVAHNLNDQAETVLMRLLRGTGLQGLTAIHHKRGKIIRPILDLTRKEIEDYCDLHQLEPRIDATNLEPIYHRNKIRLELIPMLEEGYNPNLVETLARMAEILKTDNDFIDQQAKEIYRILARKETAGVVTLPVNGVLNLHKALLVRVLRLAAEDLVGKGEVFEYRHIQSLYHLLLNKDSGHKIKLPMGITAEKSYHKLMLTTNVEKDFLPFNYQLEALEDIEVVELNANFQFEVLDTKALQALPRGKYCKAFDWEKVADKLIIRNRREGDRFSPLGLKGTKKLKDFLIDEKVDRKKRDEIPLVCDGNEIMWVVGYRISDRYKVTKKTKQILKIQFEKS